MGLDPKCVAATQRAIRDCLASDAIEDKPWLTDRRVFRFCQYLRAAADSDVPSRHLIPYLELWHNACADAIANDEDFNGDKIVLTWEDVQGQFCDLWPSTRIYPIGDFWAGMAHLPEIECVQSIKAAHIRRLASAMYHASRVTNDRSFYLSQHDAGRIIGRTQPIGRCAIAYLINAGFIVKLRQGHTGSASKYQWILS